MVKLVNHRLAIPRIAALRIAMRRDAALRIAMRRNAIVREFTIKTPTSFFLCYIQSASQSPAPWRNAELSLAVHRSANPSSAGHD